ncbi:MAG: deoxyribose-phosphate aldolase [Nitrososphaerota archaeon]|jgi:deoxyribose-phosphate aldolase|nr:deoxyribose-phosphate aldolase [Nitrososphaerota archaeon]MCL5672758.1 deoxyribose-phosphate aldolase [Nitrososphaerota archaeon]MDG6912508.1 deoxyribose-phosphate aldolase [Nitrososphaerota archaeon]MDG6936938.1 deoxyribose-phosphate aldolase [Nitrososphaerota archaeon]MDG6945448.1 deoxyribose-phosphate aldolase [Nitrososphaerota archaeon]
MDKRPPDPEAFAKRIHDTLVAPEATLSDLKAFCAAAREYRFGAVVVQGCWVKQAKQFVGDDVKVSAGVGFPMGGVTTSAKVAEIRETAGLGADMFDVMPNIGFLRSGMDEEFRDEVAAMVEEARGRPVRVMLEFTVLDREQKVRAAKLSEQAGVAGVKNSSGWGRGGPATVEDIRLLRESVSPKVHVKASGGIRDLDNALSLVDAGADYLGTRAGVAIIDELRERLAR